MNKRLRLVAKCILPWAFFLNASLANPINTFAQEAKPSELEEVCSTNSLISIMAKKMNTEESPNFYVKIDKKELKFRLFQRYFEKDELLLESSVALGRPGHSTPSGKFYLRRIVENPFWYPTKSSKSKVPSKPGKNNPFGIWMSEFSNNNLPGDYLFPGGDYSLIKIHSTNDPSSIGKFASTGCIRLPPSFAEELFPALLFYLPHKEPKKNTRGIIYPLEKTIPLFVK